MFAQLYFVAVNASKSLSIRLLLLLVEVNSCHPYLLNSFYQPVPLMNTLLSFTCSDYMYSMYIWTYLLLQVDIRREHKSDTSYFWSITSWFNTNLSSRLSLSLHCVRMTNDPLAVLYLLESIWKSNIVFLVYQPDILATFDRNVCTIKE